MSSGRVYFMTQKARATKTRLWMSAGDQALVNIGPCQPPEMREWPGADAFIVTKTHTERGILIDTLQNLGLHSFLTQDAFPHLNSSRAGGREEKFKYLKESELTC